MKMSPTDNEPATEPNQSAAGCGPLEQFIILSKGARGLAAVELIKQVLEHPNIYVFGELLDQPSIKELEENADHSSWFRLLRLFAFGVYSDLAKCPLPLPELTNQMKAKLRMLTTVTLASKNKRIPYDVLLVEIELTTLRELEDLIIEMIYSNVIAGKMDQQNSWLEVFSTISRDITADQLTEVSQVLSDWCENCDNVLANIEKQITLADKMKADFGISKSELDAHIAKVRSTIKTSNQEFDDDPSTATGGSTPSSQKEPSQLDKIRRSTNRTRDKPRLTPSSMKSLWKNNS
ncbi:COP9 signalosome complex subunit 7a [Halotydeus destructor]|nr:COP9 signalosome complex subunit 7a [Halotydeus destructor]